jgi:hypothetical protein
MLLRNISRNADTPAGILPTLSQIRPGKDKIPRIGIPGTADPSVRISHRIRTEQIKIPAAVLPMEELPMGEMPAEEVPEEAARYANRPGRPEGQG